MRLYFFIMAPILVSLIIYLLPVKKLSYLALVLQSVMLGLSISNLLMVKSSGIPISVGLGDSGIAGINLYSDLIASVFVVLITGLFFIFNIYAFDDYLKDKLFQFLFLTLEGLIILVFLSRDLFNIFVAIEVSTIICSVLIMYKRDSRSIYDGLVYLMTNTAGILFFLLGIAMIYKIFGVLDITALKGMMTLASTRSLTIPYALIMTGIALKCAFVPVFSWLPKAHGTPGAPPLVSALLSGIYIKGGIYVYIRMRDMFSPMINMDEFFIVIGILTSIFGIVFALIQKDIKLILAYHTISQMGLILIAASINDTYTKAGGLLHIMNHALFKSLLFLAAGVIIHEYKTRNLYEIRGVFRRLPFTGLAILIGILGITGAPLFNGSVSKYFIQSGVKGIWIEWFIIFINLGTTLSFVKFGSMLIPNPVERIVTTESKSKSLSMIFLSLGCLFTGLGATAISRNLLNLDVEVKLSSYIEKGFLWIGFIILSIFIYKFIISRSKFFKKGYSLELSFNDIAVTILVFFFIVLGAYRLMVPIT